MANQIKPSPVSSISTLYSRDLQRSIGKWLKQCMKTELWKQFRFCCKRQMCHCLAQIRNPSVLISYSEKVISLKFSLATVCVVVIHGLPSGVDMNLIQLTINLVTAKGGG